LPGTEPVRAALYTATGQLVQTLADLPCQPAGPHELAMTPAPLAAGAYVLVLSSGAQQWHLRLLQP